MKLKSIMFVGICAAVMSGCGGGSGADNQDSSSPRPSLPPPTSSPDVGSIPPLTSENGVSIFGQTSISQNDAVGFAIIGQNSELSQVRWRQIEGPDLQILAPHAQTIGFDVKEAGQYTLQVDYALGNSSNLSRVQYSFNVEANDQQGANIRLDHSVVERAGASLRVDSPLGTDSATIEWQQTAGPQVVNLTQQDNRLFFDAPSVSSDELISFTVRLSFPNGEEQSDEVFLTVDNTRISEDGYFARNNQVTSTDMFVANPNSNFKQAVEDCVYNNLISSTCSFNRLPLIGQTNSSPTVDDILDKTLVSHQWMADRFRQYLTQSSTGQDMLKLLRGVTAVVISYDVRPSFYWAATGAIYLDADNFWQSPEERDTLNEQPDFRSDFGSDLDFIIPWRYVKNNQNYPLGRYPSAERSSRTFEDLEADISWLMYHELGHANDFFPPNTLDSISLSSNPLSEFNANGTNSDILDVQFPLRSSEMHQLARVRFAGEDASNVQRAYQADDLIPFFEPDISPTFYSYLNEREDYATLFERFMMKYRLNASADVALITSSDNPQFIVSWGQRDRFNEEALKARVRFAVERVLPELGNVRALQETLPAPVLMDPNKSWFDNIAISPFIAGESRVPALSTESVRQSQEQESQTNVFRARYLRDIHLGKPDMPE